MSEVDIRAEVRALIDAVFDMLRSLQDFVRFRLVPQDGMFVKGFGQAYTIEVMWPDRIKRGDTFD